MVSKESYMPGKWTDDQILDYWDQNQGLIATAASMNTLSTADIICDYFPDVDKKLASQIINAIPEDFDFNELSEKIDEEHISTNIQEKKFNELEKYFHTLMPVTSGSEFISHNCYKRIGEPIATPDSKIPKLSNERMQIPTMISAHQADSQPQSSSSPQIKTELPPELKTLRQVPEKDLKKFPYRSVGKLFWFRPGDPNYVAGTAFYVGGGKIVTVAHNFEEFKNTMWQWFRSIMLDKTKEYPQRPPRQAVFVPAMIDQSDGEGKLFGRYSIRDVKPDPSYKIRQNALEAHSPCFDICSAYLSRGGRNGMREDFHAASKGQEKSSSLIPLPLMPYKPPTTEHRMWSVIGYGHDLFDGSMLRFEGIELYKKDQQNESEIIQIITAAKPGMSGGPWITTDDNVAMGIQSSIIVEEPSTSYSPRITTEILRNIEVLPSDSKETNAENLDAKPSAQNVD